MSSSFLQKETSEAHPCSPGRALYQGWQCQAPTKSLHPLTDTSPFCFHKKMEEHTYQNQQFLTAGLELLFSYGLLETSPHSPLGARSKPCFVLFLLRPSLGGFNLFLLLSWSTSYGRLILISKGLEIFLFKTFKCCLSTQIGSQECKDQDIKTLKHHV